MKQVPIEINEFQVTEDDARYPVEATKATFFNLGNIPVYVGLVPVMPGDIYQVNYEHPHIFKRPFKIRFDTTATPASATDREAMGLVNEPLLVVQTMKPEL